MSKITLEIYLPAALNAYDTQLPADIPLHQSLAQLSKNMEEVSGGLYLADSTPLLCDRESGEILNINMTPWELGLKNGTKLMLV